MTGHLFFSADCSFCTRTYSLFGSSQFPPPPFFFWGGGGYLAPVLRITMFSFLLEESEPRREKTGLRGFRPGLTQTGMYILRSKLES